jgi:restriction endonuclease S subunit
MGVLLSTILIFPFFNDMQVNHSMKYNNTTSRSCIPFYIISTTAGVSVAVFIPKKGNVWRTYCHTLKQKTINDFQNYDLAEEFRENKKVLKNGVSISTVLIYDCSKSHQECI